MVQLSPYAVRGSDFEAFEPSPPLNSVFRTAIARRVIELIDGRNDDYKKITDFDWYLGICTELCRIKGIAEVEPDLHNIIIDFVVRVQDLRAPSVILMVNVFTKNRMNYLKMNISLKCAAKSVRDLVYQQQRGFVENITCTAKILSVSRFLSNLSGTLKRLLSPSGVISGLPERTQLFFLHAALKIYSGCLSQLLMLGFHNPDTIYDYQRIAKEFLQDLQPFFSSTKFQVSQRAQNIHHILSLVNHAIENDHDYKIVKELQALLFEYEDLSHASKFTLDSVGVMESIESGGILNLEEACQNKYDWTFWQSSEFWGLVTHTHQQHPQSNKESEAESHIQQDSDSLEKSKKKVAIFYCLKL